MSSSAEVAPVAALPDAVVSVDDPLRDNKPRGKGGGIVLTVVLAFAALFWISPLALLVTTALRPLSDFVANGPLSWPQTFTLANFAEAWRIGNFATTYRNSAILLILKVPIGVLLSAMLAFALAKLRIRFGTAIMYTVFLGLTIPIYITIVPIFVMMRSWNMTDSLLGLVGPTWPSASRSPCWSCSRSSDSCRTRSSRRPRSTGPDRGGSSSPSSFPFPPRPWSRCSSWTRCRPGTSSCSP